MGRGTHSLLRSNCNYPVITFIELNMLSNQHLTDKNNNNFFHWFNIGCVFSIIFLLLFSVLFTIYLCVVYVCYFEIYFLFYFKFFCLPSNRRVMYFWIIWSHEQQRMLFSLNYSISQYRVQQIVFSFLKSWLIQPDGNRFLMNWLGREW